MDETRSVHGGVPLSAVLRRLDQSLVAPTGAPPQPHVLVREVVLWDAQENLQPVRDGALLLIGCAPTDPRIPAVIAEAARLGYSVVLLKVRGEYPTAAVAAAEDAAIFLLGAADHVPWATIESLLTTAISSYQGGIAAHLEAGDLFSLANSIAEFVGAAVTIEGVDSQLLAHSTVPGQKIDESRHNTILGREVLDLPEYRADYQIMARSTEAVRFPPHGETMARVVMPIRASGRLIGSIWAIENDSADINKTKSGLAAFMPQVALHILNETSRLDRERRRRSDLLATKLSPSSGYLVAESGSAHVKVPAALIGFTLVGETPQVVDHERLMTAITLGIEAVCNDAWCAQLDGRIWVLIPHADRFAGSWVERLVASTVREASRSSQAHLAAAFSQSIETAEGIPSVREHIELALKWLSSSNSNAVIDVVRDRHFVQLQKLADSGIGLPGQLVSQVVRLLEYDRLHGTSYAETVVKHFDYFGDVSKAAASLSIHENSHRYRMRKVTEEFQIDIDNPELRMIMWLQLRISIGRGSSANAAPAT